MRRFQLGFLQLELPFRLEREPCFRSREFLVPARWVRQPLRVLSSRLLPLLAMRCQVRLVLQQVSRPLPFLFSLWPAFPAEPVFPRQLFVCADR